MDDLVSKLEWILADMQMELDQDNTNLMYLFNQAVEAVKALRGGDD